MAELDDLNTARLRLIEVLGDQSPRYFERMKQWFKMKITKEEFDLESRKQLTKDQIHLHNQFLLCLFQKCQGLAHISRTKVLGSHLAAVPNASSFNDSDCPSPCESAKRQRLSKKRHHTERTGFEPVEVVDYLPTLRPSTYQANDEPQRNCAHELFLPDQAFLMGRLMLAAWECGLEGANDSAADFLVCAVQHFLKNLLVAVISQRNSFKTQSKYFHYGIGTSIPNPWLRNSAYIAHIDGSTEIVSIREDSIDHRRDKRDEDCDSGHLARIKETHEQTEDREVLEAACSSNNGPNSMPPISAWNLLSALQTHRSAVLSQTVYSINVERILTKLNHPVWDDEEAAIARRGAVS
ncbi:Transcriptional adapter 1 [Frankliniella fusca]|uniref:Transcriptional adapter 1 n=1 Tax=Frankliniella fusca TaxID=407009 RepID=A0AAE1LJD5_9NEOP|nr:Transcriptional adapter 1 [Frankliniella fusca]